jgi:hypothetical protein
LALKIGTGNTGYWQHSPSRLRTIHQNPAQETDKRCAAKHIPLRTFLYWACGVVSFFNVANVIMLPLPMLPVINLLAVA